MPSQVDLCNTALRRLGQEPIIALDDSIWGNRCNYALPIIISEILRQDAWRCSMKRIKLPKLSSTPIGYSSSFNLPSDFIRLIGIKLDAYQDWELIGNTINCNSSGPLEILYVFKEENSDNYSPELFDVMAWRLAVELSGYASTSSVRRDKTYQMYMFALQNAIGINSHESPALMLDSSQWIDARYTAIDRDVIL